MDRKMGQKWKFLWKFSDMGAAELAVVSNCYFIKKSP